MLTWLLGPTQRQLSGDDASRFWTTLVGGEGGKSKSGVNVTEDVALNVSAFYRGIVLIAGTVATLPIYVSKTVGRKREIIRDHQAVAIFGHRGQPNLNMDGITFRETVGASIFTRGNGLAEVQRAGGRIVAAHPIDTGLVRPEIEAGAMVYKVRRKNGGEDTLDRSQVLHLKNLGGDGLWGWSTIRRARETLGLAVAGEQAGAQIFGNGLRASGAFKTEKEYKEGAAQTFLHHLRDMYAGLEASGRPMFLHSGLEWDPFTIDPNDAQFLQTRKFQVEEICRWLGIPPHMAGLLDRATNNNIEEQSLEFLIYCLRYWLNKWESEFDRILLSDAERRQGFQIEHDTDDLLKAVRKVRYEALKAGRESGLLTVNEMRESEGYNPVGPEGDVLLYPTNMGNLENLLDLEEAEPPEPVPDPTSPPPDPATPAVDGTEPGLAHRDLLVETLARLVRKEHKAAAAAARKAGGNFLAWLDEFYPHHAELIEEAVRPVLGAWLSITRPLSTAKSDAAAAAACLAAQAAANSRSELLQLASDATQQDLPAAVDAWAQANADRAAILAADPLLGQLAPLDPAARTGGSARAGSITMNLMLPAQTLPERQVGVIRLQLPDQPTPPAPVVNVPAPIVHVAPPIVNVLTPRRRRKATKMADGQWIVDEQVIEERPDYVAPASQ